MKCINFLDTYKEISSRLKKLDMLAKSEEPITIGLLSRVLSVPAWEIFEIMSKHNIKFITKKNLGIIMREASGEICDIYRRELEIGSPLVYTKEDISYIYDLEQREIEDAFRRLGIRETTELFFPLIFKELPPRAI